MRRLLVAMALLSPGTAVRAADDPICADRPAKATGTCTVPVGRWQIETGVADWMRVDDDNRALTLGQSTLKLGLTDRSDVEATVFPYVRLNSGGARRSGVGDLALRYKRRLTANDAKVAVALVPFLKLPTAKSGIGNGMVEGGLVAPIAVPLGGGMTATFGSELDALADADRSGRHVQVIQLVNLGATVAPRLSLAGELWGAWNFDPSGTVRQASADVSAAYTATHDLAFDAGVNLGLNRATPRAELYVGFSTRF